MIHDIDEGLAPDSSAGAPPEANGRSGLARFKDGLVAEVKSRPFAYIVLAFFLVGGPILATMIFPQAPPAAAVVGGLAFGIYAALCSVPQKFM
jgi:hypothetical protein